MVVHNEPTPYYPSTALSLDELAYWIAFSRVMGIGPVRFKLLLDFFAEDVAGGMACQQMQELLAARLDQKTIDKFLLQRATILPTAGIRAPGALAHLYYYLER